MQKATITITELNPGDNLQVSVEFEPMLKADESSVVGSLAMAALVTIKNYGEQD